MNRDRGFIKIVVLIIVGVIILNYFQIDLVGLIEKWNLKPLILKLGSQIGLAWTKIMELWAYLTK